VSGTGASGDQILVEVVADRLRDGRVVRETLWVEALAGGGDYRLVKSPLVAQGLAVGDEFEVCAEDKSFRVTRRAGNLCIQLFMKPELTQDVFDDLAARVKRLGGALDAHTASIAGFWIPIDAGFPEVERLFGEFVAAHPNAQWMYGNVYGENGQQLNWW
jgi:hypothetical protein